MKKSDLWDIQYQFNKSFFYDKNIDFDKMTGDLKNEWSQKFILHISREIFEVLNELPFKFHRSYKNFKTQRKNIVEELIDVQKYLWGLFQIWEVDFEEFEEEFLRKSSVVKQRYNQEFNIDFDINKKIVIFDIDGVIANYPGYYIDFINKERNTQYKDMFDIKNNVSKKERIELKDKYRNTGIKRELPIIQDSVDFINSIDQSKYYIVLLSSRPYSKYLRIYADTLEWLKKNNINYDYIFWDEKKDRKILENFDPNQVEFMIEDNLYFSNKVSQIGIKVYLLDNIYNKGECLKNVERIQSIKEIKI